MYCRKCGKFITYDAEVCNECKLAEEQNQANFGAQTEPIYYATPVEQQPQPMNEGSVTTSLGKGIASAILAFIAYIFSAMALGAVAAAIELGGGIGIGVVLLMFTLGTGIPGLVMGIKAIKVFVAEKNAGRRKPIPTLILGIVGTAFAGIALFLSFIVFVVMVGGTGI